MNRNILTAILLFFGTSILWLLLCWHWWGKKDSKDLHVELQKQDSVINYNAGEYQMLLEEQLELQEQITYYENAQSSAKATYQRTRAAIVIRDTIVRVDVIRLVNSCDSVIASDSLVIDNLKEQLNIEARKIDNLQETVVAYEQKEQLLTEEINSLTADKNKLEKQKKRRNRALVVSSGVAVLSTFVLAILL
jgi:hypothetical protein